MWMFTWISSSFHFILFFSDFDWVERIVVFATCNIEVWWMGLIGEEIAKTLFDYPLAWWDKIIDDFISYSQDSNLKSHRLDGCICFVYLRLDSGISLYPLKFVLKVNLSFSINFPIRGVGLNEGVFGSVFEGKKAIKLILISIL